MPLSTLPLSAAADGGRTHGERPPSFPFSPFMVVGALLCGVLSACSSIYSADDFRVGDAGESDGAVDAGSMDAAIDGDGGACEVGFADCTDVPGCETEIDSDRMHCGRCGNVCGADTPVCAGGLCMAMCPSPTTECDGACRDLQTDVENCNICGVVCPGGSEDEYAVCTDGSCDTQACEDNTADCDDDPATRCEADLNSPESCGGCGVVCEAGGETFTNACMVDGCGRSECEGGRLNCDLSNVNGCEVDPLTDAAHCGGCGNVCADGVACRAGVCDPYAKVVTRWRHTCALHESGLVDCWGDNHFRQSGGEGVVVEAPQRIRRGSDDFLARDVAVGDGTTCFVSQAGELYCLGSNRDSAAGLPASTAEVSIPTPVRFAAAPDPLPTFTAVAGSTRHFCALDTTGTTWCWGWGLLGQTGLGSEPLVHPVIFDGPVAEVVVGDTSTCARLESGQVQCLGQNQFGQLGEGSVTSDSHTPVTVVNSVGGDAPLTDVSRIFAGYDAVCAIAGVDNDLFCWGYNAGGVLVSGVNVHQFRPAAVFDEGARVNGVTDVALPFNGLCWVSGDETFCRGSQRSGILGGATTPEIRNLAALIPALDGLHGVQAGRHSACGLLTDGELYCWGFSAHGTIPRDSLLHEPLPLAAEGSSLRSISLSGRGGCGVTSGGAFCWGDGSTLAMGNGTEVSSAVPGPVTTGVDTFLSVASSDRAACAVVESRTPGVGNLLHCWGSASAYGAALETPAGTPQRVPDLDGLLDVGMGENHGCARLGAEEHVYCWGGSERGEAGEYDGASFGPPHAIMGGPAEPPVSADLLAVGSDFNCLVENTEVFCWGSNDQGQLGQPPDSMSHPHPMTVSLGGIVGISAGYKHACAWIAGGSGWCWGANSDGQLGVAAGAPRPSTSAPLDDIEVMVAGARATCAMQNDGDVLCWGNNDYLQLGIVRASSHTPRMVLSGASDLVGSNARDGHGFCARVSGAWQCWGYNSYGRLATDRDALTLPVRIERTAP